MKFSYSRLDTWLQCPFKFALRYHKEIETLPTDDPQSPLILGHALHTGIETTVEKAIREYYDAYTIIDDRHIAEQMKLEKLIPEVKEIIGEGMHEIELETEDFHGFIDFLKPIDDETFDLYDFKYSNNKEHYTESPQIHLYKWYFEHLNPGKHIRNLYYLFIPKTMIRQKKTETLHEFRQRLTGTLAEMHPEPVPVLFDPNKVINWFIDLKHLYDSDDFPQNETRLCDFCEYKNYCQKGETYEMLPKNERVSVGSSGFMKGWIYGAPFSGKTTFLDNAPDPLNLNTDGNTKYVTMQRILIRDEVTGTARTTNRKFAWEILKEVIEELEKGSDFKTILLDLVEDTREMCRVYMYDKLKIDHEQDAGYGKGYDMVKTEYLSTMRRLMNLDYNIFLVSHEDISKDLTKRSGDKITRIAPNIQEALANKLAGMVDFVARVVVEDDESRKLSFKANEVTFGGGRLTALNGKEIPLDWNELVKAYEEAKKELAKESEPTSAPTPTKEETPEEKPEVTPNDEPPFDPENTEELTAALKEKFTETPAQTAPTEETPKRRTRKTRA